MAVLAVAAVVGSCTGAGPVESSGCDTPGVTSDQVKLGVVYPDTGILAASFGAVRSGVDARLGVANAAGGVHGRKIVYGWRDDGGVADKNSVGVHELVDRENVFGLIESSTVAAASASYLADKNIPVTGLAAEEVWSKHPNMFSFSYPTGAPVDTYGKFVRSRGGSRAVVLQTALSDGVSDASTKIVQSLESTGITVLGRINYSPNASSPASVAQQIIAARADVIVSVIQPADFIKILTVLHDAGKSPTVAMATIGYERQLLHTYGAAMAGMVVPIFYRPFEAGGPAIAGYIDAMTRYAPQLELPEQDLAVMSYIQADMFIRGLELAGSCPTRQGFIDGLRSVTHYDAGGLIEPVDIMHGLGKQTVCWSFVQANGAGTAFDVVAENLCGRELGS